MPQPPSSENPYTPLLTSTKNDPVQVQERYAQHRETRNQDQKKLLLSPECTGVNVDPILSRLVNEPGFEDPRHCLVFWARPPGHIRELVGKVQRELKEVVPDLWLMPQQNLHMTTLEVTHSKTEPEISTLVDQLRPHVERICDYPSTHPTTLVKPMISYDASALALSFLPCTNSEYTYHHLRHSIYELVTSPSSPSSSGPNMQVNSRYAVPSAHITIGRFITSKDFEDDDDAKYDVKKMEAFLEKIEEVNAWLESEFWGDDESSQWIVGQENGLDCRMGALWYGGGETVYLGKGIEGSEQ